MSHVQVRSTDSEVSALKITPQYAYSKKSVVTDR